MIGRRLAVAGERRVGRDRLDAEQREQPFQAVVKISIDTVENLLGLGIGHRSSLSRDFSRFSPGRGSGLVCAPINATVRTYKCSTCVCDGRFAFPQESGHRRHTNECVPGACELRYRDAMFFTLPGGSAERSAQEADLSREADVSQEADSAGSMAV